MKKAYWVGRVDVLKPERYHEYVEKALPAFEKYRARFLARGGKMISLEGSSKARNIVIEFESVEQALACYNSPEYQAAKAVRLEIADAEAWIVEGFDD